MGLFEWFRGAREKDLFAEAMMQALRRAGAVNLRYVPELFKIAIGPGRALFLDPAFAEYQAASPERRGEVLARHARLTDAPRAPASFEEALPRILPSVRDRIFFDATRLQMGLQDQPLPDFAYAPFGVHFAVELTFDLPEAGKALRREDLRRWGTNFDALLERALGNLRALSERPLRPAEPGLYVSPWRDGTDAGRALLHDYLRGHVLLGEPVVALPNRDTLLLTGDRDAEGLKALAKRVQAALLEPRPMTSLPLVLSEGTYRVFSPDPGHPAVEEIRPLVIRGLSKFYAEQKELLDLHHRRLGQGVVVGPYVVAQHKTTGRTRSTSIWSESVPTLLPETDDVVLVRTDEHGVPDSRVSPLTISWTEAREVLGDLMEATDLYPARWLVKRFPERARFDGLKRLKR